MCGENGQEYSGPTVEAICGNCGYTFSYPIPCGDRTCPVCNNRRKRDIINRMGPIVDAMKDPHFLTLTLKSRRLSIENIRKLRKYFTKLRHRDIWTGVFGGFYNIELGTLRENGLCNMHIHILYDGMDIYQPYLAYVWSRITGDSFIVDIRSCYNAQGAMHYIAKHFCKIGKFIGDASRDLINRVLKRTRLVQNFGKMAPIPPKSPSVCPECHAEGSFYTCHDPLFYDIISAFSGSEYDREPAIAMPIG